MKLLTIQQAANKALISKPSYYRLASEGLLPPPFKIGPSRSAVIEEEINAVLNARATGSDNEEIMTLVKQLVESRNEVIHHD